MLTLRLMVRIRGFWYGFVSVDELKRLYLDAKVEVYNERCWRGEDSGR